MQEVRTAFLVKSKQTHPDLHPGDPSRHEAFLRLRQAYAVLSRPQDRQLYDLTLMQQRHAAQARAAPWVDTNAPPGTVQYAPLRMLPSIRHDLSCSFLFVYVLFIIARVACKQPISQYNHNVMAPKTNNAKVQVSSNEF